MYVGICAHAYRGQRRVFEQLPYCYPPYFVRQGLTKPEAHCFGQVSWPATVSVPQC